MPIYHCSVKTIGRAAGRSSVAAAAYRSGTRLVDERQQLVHDYTHKAGVVASGIELPERAPDRWRDRQALWSEVERTERSARAQTAREIEAALPRGLDAAEQVALVRDFAAGLTARGMVVDWSIHGPGNDGHNDHVHYLMPQRSCDEDGFCAKSVTAYVCERDGERRALTTAELKEQPGWEKLYLYKGERMTMAQAEAAGLDPKADRDRRQPVQETRYLNDWNEKERVPEWRQEWQDCANRALESHYEREQVPEDEREYVDARSLADQGIDRAPTVHEGPAVHAIEQREQEQAEREGRAYEPVTRIGRQNAEIERDNGMLAQLREQIRDIAARIREGAQRLIEQVREQREQPAEPTPEQAVKAWEQAVQARSHADSRLADAYERDPGTPEEQTSWERGRCDEAKAEAAKAEESRDQAADRLRELERHPIINRAKIPEAKAELEAARAEAAKAEARAAAAKADLSAEMARVKPGHDAWRAEEAQLKEQAQQARAEAADRLADVSKALDRMPAADALMALEDRWIQEVRSCMADDLRIPSDVIEHQAERAAREIADPVQRYAALTAAAERLDRTGSGYAADRVRELASAARDQVPEPQRQQAERTASAMVDRLDQRWGAALDRTPEPAVAQQPAQTLDLRTR